MISLVIYPTGVKSNDLRRVDSLFYIGTTNTSVHPFLQRHSGVFYLEDGIFECPALSVSLIQETAFVVQPPLAK